MIPLFTAVWLDAMGAFRTAHQLRRPRRDIRGHVVVVASLRVEIGSPLDGHRIGEVPERDGFRVIAVGRAGDRRARRPLSYDWRPSAERRLAP